jgi:DsbC/DsbD-like thiol-disulfide interchange protein
MTKRCFISTGLCLVAGWVSAAPVKSTHSEAELVAEVESVKAGAPFWVAVRLQLEAGWHTYWKNPGDAGMATRIKWDLPPEWQAGPIEWPTPSRIESDGIVSFGYSGEVVLLSQVTPPDTVATEKVVRIAAKVDWLVCQDVCVPARGELELSLPVSEAEAQLDAGRTALFAAARAALPSEPGEWGFRVRPEPGGIRAMVIPPAGRSNRVESVEFFPEKQNLFSYDPVSWYRTPNGYGMELKPAATATAIATRLVGVLVTPDGWFGPGSAKAMLVNEPVQ